MSRLDTAFLKAFGFHTWNNAYAAFGTALDVPPKSVKGLRDEFDPIHPNPRRGWVGRPMIGSRARVAEDLRDVSDEALIELTRALLRNDFDETGEALDELARDRRTSSAAERLLTGRRAEDFVLTECQQVLGVHRRLLIDRRDALLGFDFEIDDPRQIVVEVKGLRGEQGDILFTDREWHEANVRRERYWIAVVGNILTQPRARVYIDPVAQIRARCVYEQTLCARWRALVSIHA
jgi:hypothetical protein